MKRIFVLICGLFILLAFSNVFAADFTIVKSPQTINVDGVSKEFEVYNIDGNNFFKLRDIAYVLNGTGSQFSVDYNEETKLIQAVKGKGYTSNGSEMKAGNDNSSSAVKSSQKLNIDGNDKEMLAYNIAGNNFFKLRDLGAELNFNVDYNVADNSVIIESKKNNHVINLNDVSIKNINNVLCVAITGDNSIDTYKDFSMFEDENKRIVVDISNSKVAIENNEINVNKNGLIKIRIGNHGDFVNRFVLDLEKSTEYKIIQSEDKKVLYIALSKSVTLEDITGKQTVIDIVESGENIVINKKSGEVLGVNEELNNRTKISSIKYSSNNNTIKITGDNTFDYTDSVDEKLNMIVFDIKNSVLSVEGPTTVTTKNKLAKEIRFYQLDDMTVRVEIDFSSKLEYKSKMSGKVLEITINEPTYQNLVYTSTSSYGTITLNEVNKEVFTTTDNTKTNTYTIKYSESRFTCGNDNLSIDDEWLKTISISTGKIVLEGKSNVTFSMEQSGKDVAVKITKKPTTTINLTDTNKTTNNNSTKTDTTPILVNHRYTVNRTSTFNVTKINDTRYLVGKAYINNTSGPEFDVNLLSKKSNIAINSNTNILIYHTHTTEGYLESGIDSNFHSTDFSKGVVYAGDSFEKYLQQKSIKVYHDRSRHDTSYNDSYDDSLEFMQNLMKTKTFDITIDLHRDAVSSDLYFGPTTTINGEKCAKLMFVMGSNAYGLEHPNWLENLKVAVLIQNKAEEMYPGLFRDISLVRWRYNQHLSPGGMLIEVGATGNSVQEVNNSMKYLANVFAALNK